MSITSCLKKIKKPLYLIILKLSTPLFLILAYLVAIVAKRGNQENKPRIVWGSIPIINNSYWSMAMKAAGYKSETFTSNYYTSINKREDWDRVLTEEYLRIPFAIKPLVAFLESLFRYDVFIISFDGFFIGNTPFAYLQSHILRIAGKKVIVVPYGGDNYIYNRIKSVSTLHGLLMSYPLGAFNQATISKNVDYWCKNADAVIPGFVGPDGLGRWDVLTPSTLAIDLKKWKKKEKINHAADGVNEKVIITHAPNHRGFKGTEFIINAVSILQREGLKVELKLLEKMQNDELRRVLSEEADILVEQLICTGHGLNALEGLSTGLPVISNLDDDQYILPLRRWSYFDECPLVSASPETIVDVLRKLVINPSLRKQLGEAGRAYVEKYHGLDSAIFLFSNIIDYVYGKKESIINLYHPLLGEYPNRSAKITHPLKNNRIVD